MNENITQQASAKQQQAASPEQSVWVSANAGTGKTRVLTNRILRLLVGGAEPSEILAVTYTRAAAAEMKNRLAIETARWAVIGESELKTAIHDVGIEKPTQDNIERARRLFAELLDKPAGIKIETVHAFAQSILKRFPIEAETQPTFKVASDEETREIKQRAIDSILGEENSKLQESLKFLAQIIDVEQLKTMASEFFKAPQYLAHAQKKPTEFIANLFAALGCKDAANDPKAAREQIITAANAAASRRKSEVEAMAEIIKDGNKTEQKIAQGIKNYFSPLGGGLDDYADIFLTKEGGVRSTNISKKSADAHPHLKIIFEEEAIRVSQAKKQIAAINIAEINSHLYNAAAEIANRYDSQKRQDGLMDYDDLIAKTTYLLDQKGAPSWVAYKLDQGLKHIMIDEAQDTSPQQWRLLAAIADEFFAQQKNDDENFGRTLFSVGDYKQSIYSFQGARPELFNKQKEKFKAAAKIAEKDFAEIELNISFRTNQTILDLVDNIAQDGGGEGLGHVPQHRTSRQGDSGFIEIMEPLQDNADAPPEPFDATHAYQGDKIQIKLARNIAEKLKEWIGRRYLPSKNRVMQAGDIIILLQKRGGLWTIIDRELRRQGLPVASADKIKINNSIAIEDLLALGDAMLLPEDDLNLASVLKSPLFGLSEDNIFEIAYNRDKKTIQQRLQSLAAEKPVYKAANERLENWLKIAEETTPYEFYRRVLTTPVRLAFTKRLGENAIHAIAQFLDIIAEFESEKTSTLQTLINHIRRADIDIKLENDARASNEIRIMTVHGAKGLEAPVIVMPDTLKQGKPNPLTYPLGGDMPIYAPAEASKLDAIFEAKENIKNQQRDEDNRLLYVALTRAEDGLLIAGFEQSRKRTYEGSWYEKIATAAAKIDPAKLRGQDRAATESAEEKIPEADHYPQWIHQAPAAEAGRYTMLSPSQQPSSKSPMGEGRQKAMLRGTLIHRLLEILPGLSSEAQTRAANRIIAPLVPQEFSQIEANDAIAEAQNLMQSDDLSTIFSKDGRTEVPISGKVNGQSFQGIVDRLIIEEKRITIIDFKSGSPPENNTNIPESYQRQMEIYRQIICQIWPSREVRAGLVFTENASLFWCHNMQ